MIENVRDLVHHIGHAAAWLMVAILCLSFVSCATFRGWQAGGEYDKGIALFNQGKYQEAVPHFEKATRIDPDYYSAYLYLGRCYLNLKQYTNAVQPLRTAYRLSPAEFQKEIFDMLLDALFGAATSAVKQGSVDEAIGYFKYVLTLDARSDKAKEELARLYIARAGDLLKQGNIDEAVRAYSDVLKVTPNNVTAYLGLITAFIKSGNISKALETAEKAHILDPNSKELLRILKELIGK